MMLPSTPLHIALVGFGAIGQALARRLGTDSRLRVTQVIVNASPSQALLSAAAQLLPQSRVLDRLDVSPGQRPDLVVECAGHAAVNAHLVPALQAGIPCVMASVGALHDPALLQRLESAAAAGNTRVQLASGAIGAVDALAAAQLGGLDEVIYVGRKPPLSWRGTPAEQVCDLSQLTSPQVIFRGSARQAAHGFPKNTNVAATVSLAGLGLDHTQVELIADPGVTRNVHTIMARGAFGYLELLLENYALPDNPKTSALTVYSLERAVRNAADRIVF